jgi:hypothetical protein
VLLESLEDVRSKLVLRKREPAEKAGSSSKSDALQAVVAGIRKALEQTSKQRGFRER